MLAILSAANHPSLIMSSAINPMALLSSGMQPEPLRVWFSAATDIGHLLHCRTAAELSGQVAPLLPAAIRLPVPLGPLQDLENEEERDMRIAVNHEAAKNHLRKQNGESEIVKTVVVTLCGPTYMSLELRQRVVNSDGFDLETCTLARLRTFILLLVGQAQLAPAARVRATAAILANLKTSASRGNLTPESIAAQLQDSSDAAVTPYTEEELVEHFFDIIELIPALRAVALERRLVQAKAILRPQFANTILGPLSTTLREAVTEARAFLTTAGITITSDPSVNVSTGTKQASEKCLNCGGKHVTLLCKYERRDGTPWKNGRVTTGPVPGHGAVKVKRAEQSDRTLAAKLEAAEKEIAHLKAVRPGLPVKSSEYSRAGPRVSSAEVERDYEYEGDYKDQFEQKSFSSVSLASSNPSSTVASSNRLPIQYPSLNHAKWLQNRRETAIMDTGADICVIPEKSRLTRLLTDVSDSDVVIKGVSGPVKAVSKGILEPFGLMHVIPNAGRIILSHSMMSDKFGSGLKTTTDANGVTNGFDLEVRRGCTLAFPRAGGLYERDMTCFGTDRHTAFSAESKVDSSALTHPALSRSSRIHSRQLAEAMRAHDLLPCLGFSSPEGVQRSITRGALSDAPIPASAFGNVRLLSRSGPELAGSVTGTKPVPVLPLLDRLSEQGVLLSVDAYTVGDEADKPGKMRPMNLIMVCSPGNYTMSVPLPSRSAIHYDAALASGIHEMNQHGRIVQIIVGDQELGLESLTDKLAAKGIKMLLNPKGGGVAVADGILGKLKSRIRSINNSLAFTMDKSITQCAIDFSVLMMNVMSNLSNGNHLSAYQSIVHDGPIKFDDICRARFGGWVAYPNEDRLDSNHTHVARTSEGFFMGPVRPGVFKILNPFTHRYVTRSRVFPLSTIPPGAIAALNSRFVRPAELTSSSSLIDSLSLASMRQPLGAETSPRQTDIPSLNSVAQQSAGAIPRRVDQDPNFDVPGTPAISSPISPVTGTPAVAPLNSSVAPSVPVRATALRSPHDAGPVFSAPGITSDIEPARLVAGSSAVVSPPAIGPATDSLGLIVSGDALPSQSPLSHQILNSSVAPVSDALVPHTVSHRPVTRSVSRSVAVTPTVLATMTMRQASASNESLTKQALQVEMLGMHKLGVFAQPTRGELRLHLSGGGRILRSLIQLKIKSPTLFKARLCAGGDAQDKTSYHDSDRYAPTVATSVLLAVINVCAALVMIAMTFDVVQAFLRAQMPPDRPIYVRLSRAASDAFCEADPSYGKLREKDGTLVVKLVKALYGCLESAKLFYDLCRAVLISIGFRVSTRDPCVFFKLNSQEELQEIICMHVDDGLVFARSQKQLDQLSDSLLAGFGDVVFHHGDQLPYLGMNLDLRESGYCTITMPKFVAEILPLSDANSSPVTPAADNVFDVNPLCTPLNQNDAIFFHSLVAKFAYLARVRPDIRLAVSALASRVREPNKDDWKNLRRLHSYVRDTADLGMRLGARSTGLQLTAFIDAAFGNRKAGRSQSGSVFTFGGGAFRTNTSTQGCTSKSTAEAELVAISDNLSPLIGMAHFLREIGQAKSVSPILLYEDNLATIKLVERGGPCSDSSRHIENRRFFAHQYLLNGELQLVHCPTEMMLADGLTKPLQGALFLKHRAMMLGNKGAPLYEGESLAATRRVKSSDAVQL